MRADSGTAFLRESDARDRVVQARFEAWCLAWRLGHAAAGPTADEQYEAGWRDGLLAAKGIQHRGYEYLQLELARWDGPREHFGRPRPGDFKGGSLRMERPGQVYLSGAPVHFGRCNNACGSYKPGWYRPAEAAAILATLPHDYREAIDRLSRLSRSAA